MSNHRLSPQQLQDRLTRFGISVCRNLQRVKRDPVSDYFTLQLIKSSTSPGANYSEAADAESQRDFIHKMKICLKELREALYWLHFKSGVSLDSLRRHETRDENDDALAKECDELIAIFVASLKTARRDNRPSI